MEPKSVQTTSGPSRGSCSSSTYDDEKEVHLAVFHDRNTRLSSPQPNTSTVGRNPQASCVRADRPHRHVQFQSNPPPHGRVPRYTQQRRKSRRADRWTRMAFPPQCSSAKELVVRNAHTQQKDANQKKKKRSSIIIHIAQVLYILAPLQRPSFHRRCRCRRRRRRRRRRCYTHFSLTTFSSHHPPCPPFCPLLPSWP